MKLKYLINFSGLLLGLILLLGVKAEAQTVEVINQTPFNFQGGIIRFFDSREYFSIPSAINNKETDIFFNFEGSFFSPSLVVTLADYSKELCYFSGVDSNLSLTISYNGCSKEKPDCVLRCEGKANDSDDGILEDTIEVSYITLAP